VRLPFDTAASSTAAKLDIGIESGAGDPHDE
jgi:hypothetical protein